MLYSKHDPSLPLSSHNIDRLAQFIQSAFKHFGQCISSYEKTYRESIYIISNCYSLVLCETDQNYDKSLKQIRQKNYFKNDSHTFEELSITLAQRISLIAEKIPLVDWPWFYTHFSDAINTLFNATIIDCEEDITDILKLKHLSKIRRD